MGILKAPYFMSRSPSGQRSIFKLGLSGYTIEWQFFIQRSLGLVSLINKLVRLVDAYEKSNAKLYTLIWFYALTIAYGP